MPISDEQPISDDKLMLLEQLTYLSPDVARAAGIEESYSPIDKNKGVTVEQYLSQFSEDALNKLEKNGTVLTSEGDSTYAQGNEWAAIIRSLKSDPEIKDLKISNAYSNPNDKTAAICFTDEKKPEQAVVAFRGTLDGDEWADNVEGLNATDTEAQKDALEFIESLPYNDITVVGHSKGGNKAQYVTVLSDKVTRCVSMDGQGFSKEFIEKYWAEILAKGGAIKNYSLNNDFVHILLFPIPGSEQLYFAGSGMENGAENHAPNSYFYIEYKDGHAVLKYDGDQIYLNGVDEEYSSIAYLHDFVSFVLNVMPDADKAEVVSYLGNALKLAMGDKNVEIEIDGVVYTKDKLLDYILSNPETASLVAAYLIDYIKIYELTEDQVYDLLEAFGLGDMAKDIKKELGENALFAILYSGGKGLLGLLLDNITDGKDDPLIAKLLSWLRSYLKKNYGVDFDCAAFWKMVEKEYGKIGDVDKSTATKNATVKTGKRMNFSKERYNLLLSTIGSIESSVFGDVSSWSNYSGEEWYSSLGISVARSGINLYIDKLSDINSTCKSRIETVFSNEWAIDSSASKKISSLMDEISDSITGLGQLAERLAP